jgi:beta-lactamase class D
MKLRNIVLNLLALVLFISCISSNKKRSKSVLALNDTIAVHQEFKKYFDSCKVSGSIAIYDNVKKKWILSDTIDTNVETLPASTFKIINLLIALETKTISDENEVMKWVKTTDTVKYGYRPEIYHDMSIKEAFEVSAGWVFVELAKKIGRENYKRYLTLAKYGNSDLSQKDPDFWNFGAFGISPINQIEFLKKLYSGKLPFSKRNIEIVKKVMLNEDNEQYSIHSKTGWTRENGFNLGWWVGYIENEKGTYFFATRLLQNRNNNTANFGNYRKEITKSIFKELAIID